MILELLQALVREAVAMGLVAHDHPVYLYNPALNCSNTYDEVVVVTNLTASREVCNQGAGIALLVIFTLICLIPSFFGLLVICAVPCKNLSCLKLSGSKSVGSEPELDYDGEDFSPIITSFNNMCQCECTRTKCDGTVARDHVRAMTNSNASLLAFLLKSISVTLYFFGDNLEPILHRYGECLNCDQECVQSTVLVAKGAVVVSTIMFHAFPHLIKLLAKKLNWPYEPHDAYQALGIFGIVLKAQSTYSSIIAIFQGSAYCSIIEQLLGWLLLVVTTIIATGWIIHKAISFIFNNVIPDPKSPTTLSEKKVKDMKRIKCIYGSVYGSIIGLLAFTLILLFLLGDNMQPLDCTFNCDFPGSANEDTLEVLLERESCCQIQGNVVTRVILIATGIIIGFAFCVSLLAIPQCAKKRNRVVPSTDAQLPMTEQT